METPVYDFVKRIAQQDMSRFFMPGHKGNIPYDTAMQAVSRYDITEITGADVLFEAEGIIGKSEQNASKLFGSQATLYSAQGSTLAIQTMVSLVFQHGGRKILAGRNAHHAFLYACELLRMDIAWLLPEAADAYGICGMVMPEQVERALKADPELSAVYVTSPDYLGNTADIAAISEVCRRHHVVLLCDNAHGAYLKFCGESRHPLDLGADVCCDSAHKTLPVLTGGAYLHLSASAPYTKEEAKEAMSRFSSTSPSYLILTSLDLCNRYLEERAVCELSDLRERVACFQRIGESAGIYFLPNNIDFAKITIDAVRIGWDGIGLRRWLEQQNIGCEYANSQYVVLMATPFLSDADWIRLENAIKRIPVRKKMNVFFPSYCLPVKRMPAYEAVLQPWEEINIEDAAGRTAAQAVSSCPPGVPVIVAGEVINSQIKNICKNSGKIHIKVLK